MDNNSIAPSKLLPSIKVLHNTPTSDISQALHDLAILYDHRSQTSRATTTRKAAALAAHDGKEIISRISSRASRRTRKLAVLAPDSGYASAEEESDSDVSDGEQMEQLRNDPFEKSFAMRWLTGFIARADEWTYVSEIGDELDSDEVAERETLVELAASILSLCASAGCEGAGDISRGFDFPFGSPTAGQDSICVELNDAALSDKDHNSVGLQSWASSIVLSRYICQDPARYNFCNNQKKLRILELGAGTGLLSIAAAKIMEALNGEAFVIATDYHRDVLSNLRHNVEHNFGSSLHDSVKVEVYSLDWETPRSSAPFDEPFDIILAADVIYNPLHAGWIKNCVERYLRLPATRYHGALSNGHDGGGVFWLIIPIRTTGRHEGVGATVDETFPLASIRSDTDIPVDQKIAIMETIELPRNDGVGRADEMGYRLFKLGWCNA
jgi:predicted nicotinamide N-methyase